jgi:hypothetical protein
MSRMKIVGSGSVFLLMLLAANCAAAVDLRNEGVRSDYVLGLAPRQAARCLARNAELRKDPLKTRIRETDTLVIEVEVRQNDLVVALAHLAPWKSGAVATIWRDASTGRLADAMADGC